jgi:predicted ATPase
MASLSSLDIEMLRDALRAVNFDGAVRRTSWIVLIGAPGSGKSTLVQQIANLGHETVSDPGRAILEEDLRVGLSIQSSRQDYRSFQWRTLRHSLSLMAKLNDGHHIFFDYGIAECLAFLKVANLEWEETMVRAVVEVQFATAFALEMIPDSSVADDHVRIETAHGRHQLQDLMLEIYSVIGPKPIWIPFSKPSERLSRVLEAVGRDSAISTSANLK